MCSRRHAEELIRKGRVRVNGRVTTELGVRANPRKDRIEVDGRRIARESLVYLLLHKPKGTVTTLEDPRRRRTVIDCLSGVRQRVFPVGRLDYNVSGALLLTNDGELSESLAHPRNRVPKIYRLKLGGVVQDSHLKQLREGVMLEDGLARAQDLWLVARNEKHSVVQLTLLEGRNRQIHRMAQAIGFQVEKLARISFAGLGVEGLPFGHHRHLTGREVGRLKRDYVRANRSRVRGRGRLPPRR